MNKPGNALNVPCDWCVLDEPSVFTKVSMKGIRYYACPKHKEKLEDTIETINRYKTLSKIT